MNSLSFKAIFQRPKLLFNIFGIIILASIAAAVLFDSLLLLAIPAGLLFLAVSLIKPIAIYYLLVFLIPYSIEVSLPGGFGTDLPTEPLIVGLMFLTIFYLFQTKSKKIFAFLLHPISLVLYLHFAWMCFTTICSTDPVISIKFLLAKFWYIMVFYVLTGIVLHSKKNIKLFVYGVGISIFITILYALFNQASMGFVFEDVNLALKPFYRNHVNYASLLALFLPFVVAAFFWIPWKKLPIAKLFAAFVMVIFLCGIYFSYTRAAIVSVLGAFAMVYVIKWKLVPLSFLLVILMAGYGLFNIIQENKYLDLAPEFERTIAHKKFDNLIEATVKGEDVSTMERLYRWVAGFRMVKEKPLTGFGPGTFYFSYMPFTLNMFETYVSDNPEKSGIHSYYIMSFVEQGVIGGLIFIFLCFYLLWKVQLSYHHEQDFFWKSIIMASGVSFAVILSILLINDMIETDKVGSFFFIAMALVVHADLRKYKALKKPN